MLRLYKQLLAATFFVIIAGCSGGGCSSGCSCAGVTPLAEGFPAEARMENVASVRLTDSGITFLEDNIGTLAGVLLGDQEGMGGIITFEVPTTSTSLSFLADVEVCRDGANPNANPPECIVEIDLENAQLQVTPTAPHNIVISGPLPVRIQKLPFRITYVSAIPDNLDIVINDGGSCAGGAQPFGDIAVDANISIEIDNDMAHSRYGYSRIRVLSVDIDNNDILDNIGYCDNGLGITGALLDLVDDFAIDLIKDQLIGSLAGSLDEAFCQAANPDLNPTCPTGTSDNGDGVCRFQDGSCASFVLGLDGNIDLGGLLASFSPGTTGGFDFLLAVGGHSMRPDGSGFAFGDLNPIAGGVSLGMYGGTEPTPLSGCVTPENMERPMGIPQPDELLSNSIANWPLMEGPHFGLALSERYMNYTLAQLYNSGALCLGITAAALGGAVPLSTSLIGVGLGAPSMNELGRQKQAAEVAILLRPGAAPSVTVGNGTDIETDPLLRIKLDQVAFDFYVFSLDRYVRAFTATMDLDVPMNLMVSDEGLSPVIDKLGVANATVTNSALIREDGAMIAAALQGLLGDLVGGFLGDALPPIDLNEQLSSLGVGLEIPPTVDGQGSPGLRLLTKDQDNFLGIFANLAVAQPMMASQQMMSATTAELQELYVTPEGLRLDTMSPDNVPSAVIRVGSNLDNGMHAVEYQYKLDGGPWHPFTRDRVITVDDEWLRLQGRHTVFVRSRVVGDIFSLDDQPAEVTVIIDDELPKVSVRLDEAGQIIIDADDHVSGKERTEVRMRFRLDDHWSEWSAWMRADAIAAIDAGEYAEIEVEARDEDGNIGTASSALIRGRDDGGDGCNCEVAGAPARSGKAMWLLSLAFGLIIGVRRRRIAVRRRRIARKTLTAACFIVAAGLWSGCSCGDDGAKKSSGSTTPADGCRARGDCSIITPGLVGAYTSAAATADGTVWVAGYLEANWLDELSYGDLVVGVLNEGNVDWKVVDGVPEEEVDPESYDTLGFRGGVTGAGDDVGLWTSIAVDAGGTVGVAYWDTGRKALKYASRNDDDTWDIADVQVPTNGDVGRYAKLRFVNGQPNIAYLFIEAGGAQVKTGVRMATGSAASAAGASWTFSDVAVNEDSPCYDGACGSGTVCIQDTMRCATEAGGCPEACPEDEACVDNAGQARCEPVVAPAATESYPDAYGLYISLDEGPSGLGLAFYDRIGGNVVVATQGGGAWSTVIADGHDVANDVNTGDKGVGLSLDIDSSGDYHLAYVNGLSESLDYVRVTGGTTPGAPEMVDDGLSAGDGVHLIGDDSSIAANASGDITISYQDATTGDLRYAVGSPAGNIHNWTSAIVAQDGFAGAFSQQIDVGGSRQILNWWRVAAPNAEGNVRLVSPP